MVKNLWWLAAVAGAVALLGELYTPEAESTILRLLAWGILGGLVYYFFSRILPRRIETSGESEHRPTFVQNVVYALAKVVPRAGLILAIIVGAVIVLGIIAVILLAAFHSYRNTSGGF